MLYRVEGIILRSMDYGEGNKIVTLLTNTHGKAGVMIRGAKKPKSRYGSLSQPFTHGEFVYFKGSGLGTLSSGEIIASHHKLREQLELAAYAAYAAELTDRALQDEDAGAYVFEQLRACFAALEEGKDPAVTIHLYEMKILQAAGYSPVLDVCASCGREEGPFAFSPRMGGIVCIRCRASDPYALRPGDGALKLLRLFGALDLRRLGEIRVKAETKAELKACMRALLDAHLGLRLKSRAFLDSLDALQAPERAAPAELAARARRGSAPAGHAAEQAAEPGAPPYGAPGRDEGADGGAGESVGPAAEPPDAGSSSEGASGEPAAEPPGE